MKLVHRVLPCALACALACAALAACGDPARERSQREAASRARVAAESAVAARVGPTPTGGRWDKGHLVERLVSMGLAPQRIDTVRGQSFMGVPVLAFQVGQTTLEAYLYADSLARRDVVARLDPRTLAPRGTNDSRGPYPEPHDLVVNNNLAAVLIGGTDRQRERIANAIAAGLAAP